MVWILHKPSSREKLTQIVRWNFDSKSIPEQVGTKTTVITQHFSGNAQQPADVAVVIQTVLRPTLLRAVRSVFDQDHAGTIQVLIGIDFPQGDSAQLDTLARECPSNVILTVLDLGYSTSLRHGGIYNNHYGGALRTILSYAANSRYVAYLDDDDWWGRQHLSSLLSAIHRKDWAFSYRWLVDRETGWPICRDEWDSVGPGAGINLERYGGFVNPGSLMLDKAVCHLVLPFWSLSPCDDGSCEDRLVFRQLLKRSWAATGKYTSYYEMEAEVQKHAHHAREFAARRIGWVNDRTRIAEILGLLEEAQAALKRGDFDAAVSKCRPALALNPHHPRALYCLALAQWRTGSLSEAFSHISHAVAADDRDTDIVALWTEIFGAGVGAALT
ncbi:MAG: tetratricopeptide repeat protein [Syntrophobacteraceae bacterium]|nr:tetratricopeptide repeat protein [Syntrophobacteraceae bacterium]